MTHGKTTGIVCTVLGSMLSLWVIARLSSAIGWQQTWAPWFTEYLVNMENLQLCIYT